MRRMAALIFLTVACGAVSAKEVPTGFTTLPEAVSFIASCLDAGDHARLDAACLRRKPSDHTFSMLQYAHKKTPLVKLYAGREFPAQGAACTLGGHNRELGHIHIDFVKRGDVWLIDSIWICR